MIDFGTHHATTPTIFSTMAPHALTDLNDPSGYYPSASHQTWSQTPAYRKGTKVVLKEPIPSAKLPFGNLGFGSESPKNVWNLSSNEIVEVEKNVRHFLSMHEV